MTVSGAVDRRYVQEYLVFLHSKLHHAEALFLRGVLALCACDYTASSIIMEQ
jgi:hypothetical protein